MKELWKDIKEFEGLYQISSNGRVKSLGNGNSNNSKERILKPAQNKDGYLYVILYKEGVQKNFKIHRLVAQAFIDNHNNYEEVNHKDENKQNNRVDNLEFCTHFFNINYGTRTQRSALSRSKQVMCLETGKIYPSTMEVERELGFTHSNIIYACNGKLKTCGGFHWKYVV